MKPTSIMTPLQAITELEKDPPTAGRSDAILQLLMDHARLSAGWKKCPECSRWHQPTGLSLLACGCGHPFVRGYGRDAKV